MKSTITKLKDNSCQLLNNRLSARILELTDEQVARKTHYFDGRYENIYVDIETIDELKTLIEQAKVHAAEILEKDINSLKIGFWINIMRQGNTTSLHSHEDVDELLSGVYYVSVPENSGQFIYYLDAEKYSLQPEEGCFLFFSPALLHEVTEHQSDKARISVAFNIGPVEADE